MRHAPAILRYGASLALALLAFALQHIFDPLGDTLLFPAILLIACSAGPGPALLALAVCEAAARYASPFPESPLRPALFLTLGLATIAYVYRQRQMVRKHRQNEERMALSLSAGNIGYWDWDLKTGALALSKAFCEEWGLPSSAAAHTLADCLPFIHEDDRDRVLRKIESAVGRGEPYDIDYRIRRPSGEILWIRARGQMYTDDEGLPARLAGITINITERKRNELALRESERKFRELADSMPQMVWTAGADGQPEYRNAKWYEYTGLSGDRALGAAGQDCVHPEEREQAKALWAKAIETGSPFEMEVRFRCASDSAYRWVLIRALPHKDEEGRVTRWYGTNTDIEDQKRAQEELSTALRARDDFLSIASHELKTPITSLRLHSQLLLKKALRGDSCIHDKTHLSGFARQTDKQVARIARLVDDMLDIGRIRSGRLAIRRESMDLSELLREMVERAREHRDVAISLELPGPCEGRWDRARLEQAFENLLTNAILYGQGKPVGLRLTAAPGKVRVEFEDRGIGIGKEAQARIFERFERAVDSNEVSGLGLGLFIARQIVTAHGGKIWVESEPGTGSIFYIELPCEPAGNATAEVSLLGIAR